MQAQDIIYAALREIGWLRAAGQTAATEVLSDCLLRLNRLMSEWSVKRQNIYSQTRIVASLSTGKQIYTIGPSGADITAAVRPVAISSANVLTASDSLSFPIFLGTYEQFAGETERLQQGAIANILFYDGGYPLGSIYLHPAPSGSHTLELICWTVLSQFPLLSSTFDLPPGYELAIITNLAIALGAMLGLQPAPSLVAVAQEAEAAVRSANGPPFPGKAAEILSMQALAPPAPPQQQPQQ